MTTTRTEHDEGLAQEEDRNSPSSPTDSNEDSASYEEEEEDEETTWTEELRNSWRQHCVAILIAVAATALAYFYQQQKLSSMILSKHSERQRRSALSAPSSLAEAQAHAHLRSFQRTANITFCGSSLPSFTQHNLQPMDFHIPDSLIPLMILFFQHDLLEYDTFHASISPTAFSVSSGEEGMDHPEIRCLRRLQDASSQPFVKGITYFYKAPSFASMYPTTIETEKESLARAKKRVREPAVLSFTGFAAQFVNLATEPVLLYWDGRTRRVVGEIAPFEALSTATRPGESFSVAPLHDPTRALDRWTVTADDPVLYYEPETEKKKRNGDEEIRYQMQKLNQAFAQHYWRQAGRAWLSNFPRAFPMHYMYPADFVGQTHEIAGLSLQVVSVTPRVLRIPNFLSTADCEALLQLAGQQGWEASTVFAGGEVPQRDRATRSSSQTWLARRNVTDRIYRRAAQVLQIDEAALLGHPEDWEEDARYHSVAESLQVIRYKEGEEYTPHHDWVVASPQNRYQPSRFATLLIYLNTDYEGGHTVFPRAVTAHDRHGLKIEPEQAGTAILFYNMLPDGNVDDLSQHGSEKVTRGEKYAANLWIWDPVIN